MALTKTIAVGSQNPVKIKSVYQAFSHVWPGTDWQVRGYPTQSGVSNQPMSDLESIRGARSRAQSALSQGADYGVGSEGGLQKIGTLWFDCGWFVVIDSKGWEGIGSSARIIVPPKMMKLIHQGYELGDVIDQLFHTHNAKQRDGHFGLMTNNAITRTSGYRDGVIMALCRFIKPEIF